jgi:cystathionine beta-lyase/cystathionine gamma-synthase
VNDVYGGTFRYLVRVAKVTMGTETTFLDLENAADDEVLGAMKENTKVCLSASPLGYRSHGFNSSFGSNHQQTPLSD